MLTEKKFSLKTKPRLPFTTPTNTRPTKWESTNSQPLLTKNSNNNSSDWTSQKDSKPLKTLLMTLALVMLIGPHKVPSLQLRIKDNAVHVGLSQPPVLWKVWANSLSEVFKASLSNNSLTVQDHSETKPVTEVWWTTLSNTSRLTVSFMKMNTHTRLSSKLVLKTQELSRFQVSLTSRTATLWLLLWLEDQFQLPLMPPTGQDIHQESSTTVQPDLTTVSFWSVPVINIGELKTHGELLGEKVDSSDLPEETPAVSATLLHIQTNDLNIELISNFYCFFPNLSQIDFLFDRLIIWQFFNYIYSIEVSISIFWFILFYFHLFFIAIDKWYDIIQKKSYFFYCSILYIAICLLL